MYWVEFMHFVLCFLGFWFLFLFFDQLDFAQVLLPALHTGITYGRAREAKWGVESNSGHLLAKKTPSPLYYHSSLNMCTVIHCRKDDTVVKFPFPNALGNPLLDGQTHPHLEWAGNFK